MVGFVSVISLVRMVVCCGSENRVALISERGRIEGLSDGWRGAVGEVVVAGPDADSNAVLVVGGAAAKKVFQFERSSRSLLCKH